MRAGRPRTRLRQAARGRGGLKLRCRVLALAGVPLALAGCVHQAGLVICGRAGSPVVDEVAGGDRPLGDVQPPSFPLLGGVGWLTGGQQVVSTERAQPVPLGQQAQRVLAERGLDLVPPDGCPPRSAGTGARFSAQEIASMLTGRRSPGVLLRRGPPSLLSQFLSIHPRPPPFTSAARVVSGRSRTVADAGERGPAPYRARQAWDRPREDRVERAPSRRSACRANVTAPPLLAQSWLIGAIADALSCRIEDVALVHAYAQASIVIRDRQSPPEGIRTST